MAIRRRFWLLGLAAGGSLIWILRPHLAFGLLALGFGAVTLLVVLMGELRLASALIRSPARVGPPPGARPADGRIDLAILKGAKGVPNQEDPRFRAFRSFDPVEGVPVSRPLQRAVPSLLGRVTLISLFMGRDGCPWSDAEIARAHAAMIRAGEWIEREAIRWNAPVNLSLAETYFVADLDEADDVEMMFVSEGDGVGPIEANAVTKALIDASRAASMLGFRDAVDWMEQVRGGIEADALVWILHPRRAGRSLAVPLDMTELAGVSLVVCYAREASFPEPLTRAPWTDPVTVVHELLHLFGATDKYGTALRSYPPRSVSSRDIMRLNRSKLSQLRIDPQTAREVGWCFDDRGSEPEPAP